MAAPLHVGVDATCWHNKRGYGRQGRALLRALVRSDSETRYTFFLDAEPNGEPVPDGAELRLVRSSAPAAVAASADGRRSVADMWRMSRALSSAGCDVLLFPTVYSFVPVLSRAKKIVMIHDVIAEKFPHLTVPRTLARLFWRAKVGLGRRQADAIVTVSEHSRRGIAEHFKLDVNRVYVVGEASDPEFCVLEDPRPTPRLQNLGLGDDCPTVTYVGGFNPHKNLETLVTAFAAIAGRIADARMVLVGEYQKEVFHSHYAAVRRRVDDLGLAGRVVFTGFLPDEELVVLLNRSTVLALPSLLEGFGLPAVEAAACGCPVIATTASPLPDLLGAGGRFVDPTDTDGWAAALSAVLGSADLRASMSRAALEAAGKLSWEAAARQMMDVLHMVAA